ncbi:unnamed protein product [Rotaria socialis]|uniref:DUF218 domain-containing protein n=1 Tax=Rotaria socialis TaxID=392032 RepID=A0A821FVH5_9BILA|nr:unnamed protein product [Rotaria socialis]CAF4656653.1 unnamed protein product [Rotaria socialis]
MTYDCIVILGGGADLNGSPSAWVCARLDRVIEMASSVSYFLVLSRCTTHHPPVLDKNLFPIDEATASAAYFARQCIMEPMDLHRLAVITNDFHMT